MVLGIVTLVILVHEIGHFIVLKRLGYDVEEFAVGMGRKILQVSIKGTLYTLKLIPLGGHVKPAEKASGKRSLESPSLDHIGVLMMGAVFNFLFAIILFFAIALLSEKSIMLSLEWSITSLSNVVESIIPLLRSVENYSSILGFVTAFNTSQSMPEMVRCVTCGEYKYVSEHVQTALIILEQPTSLNLFLARTALMSISIGLFNLIPLPILDGGKIVLDVIQLVIGRKINETLLKLMQIITYLLLMGFMILLLMGDAVILLQNLF